MRITCPNCQAQYDVDPSMIPEAGRDVQCSSCAHTWFQSKLETEPDDMEAALGGAVEDEPGPVPGEPDGEAVQAAETDVPEEAGDEVAAETPPEEEPQDVEEAEAVPEREAEAKEEPEDVTASEPEAEEEEVSASDAEEEPVAETAEAASEESAETASEPEPEVPVASEPETEAERDEVHAASAAPTEDTSALDQSVAEILREEAEFEVTRRRGQEAPPALDEQPDLGLDEGRPSDVLRERLERMRGDGVPEPTIVATSAVGAVAAADGPRRERLPDIEEINSSLRPATAEEDDEPPLSPSELAATRRSGFRRGFAAVILLTAFAIGAYVYAPQIIRAVPAIEPAMISYVEIANSARDRIDGMMARAVSSINAATGEG